MLELGQYLSFVDDLMNASFGQHPSLGHFFHGESLTITLPDHFPNLAKPSFADWLHILEV